MSSAARDLAETLAMFVAALLLGASVISLAAALGLNPQYYGAASQAFLLAYTLILIRALKSRSRDYGFTLTRERVIEAFLVSLVTSTPLTYAATFLAEGEETPVELPENPLLMLTLTLLVAPICEEAFFRGLLEGHLLLRGRRRLAVALPAALFSLTHAVPFSQASPQLLLLVLLAALVLGLIAGYYRAKTDSLTPSIIAHATFNLTGYLAALLTA